MAGLSKEALAAKTAYLTANPDTDKEWKDLTEEEKLPWFSLPANQDPYGSSQVDPDTLKKLPSGQVVDGAALNVEPTAAVPFPADLNGDIVLASPDPHAPSIPTRAEVMRAATAPFPVNPAGEVSPPSSVPLDAPQTDPEHGDLTPDFARWYLATKGRAATLEKYATRLHLIPDDVRARLEGGAA